MIEFLGEVSLLLKSVLAGNESYQKLQNLVDSAIVNEALPHSLSDDQLETIFKLQTDLELLSVEHDSLNESHQCVGIELIEEFLTKYESLFEE